MTGPIAYHFARQTFEAARRTGGSGDIHGHGFEARVIAAATQLSAPFSGAETDHLAQLLHARIAPLDYTLLDRLVEQPHDDALARWILQGLNFAAGAGATALRSAPDRGAIVKGGADGGLVWLTRRFEAAHQLPNVPAGHKCGRMHGHGFEVALYAAVDEGVDAGQGQRGLAEAWRPLGKRLHLTCLNDLPGLDNPTSEVLAQWIWQELQDKLPGLAGVTVMETGSAGCHFDGAQWRIWTSMTFDSAVRLAAAPQGDRRSVIHGHTYTTRLHLSGGLDDVLGWVHDYGDVKRRFDPVFRALDHRPLYEQPGLNDNDPVTIARWIDHAIADELPGLSRIDVLETPGCGAIVLRGDDTRGLLVP